jgi:hypothetical protein
LTELKNAMLAANPWQEMDELQLYIYAYRPSRVIAEKISRYLRLNLNRFQPRRKTPLIQASRISGVWLLMACSSWPF